MSKVLVAYFSASGVTRKLANNLADAGKRFSQAPVRIGLSQHYKHNKMRSTMGSNSSFSVFFIPHSNPPHKLSFSTLFLMSILYPFIYYFRILRTNYSLIQKRPDSLLYESDLIVISLVFCCLTYNICTSFKSECRTL